MFLGVERSVKKTKKHLHYSMFSEVNNQGDLYDTCSPESLFTKALFTVFIFSSYCEMVFGARFEI